MTLDEIQKTIEQAVPESKAYVLDPMNDGNHLQAFVVSAHFEGMPLIKQHQLVMKPLKSAFEASVHALGLKTFTPDKWKDQKGHYGIT